MAPSRQIAILGGGPAALAAAYYLTARPGWQQDYTVTIYQAGWRLGGKCASARNPEAGNRIEEHGLHVWIGNYENAFALMRRCYADPARPSGSRLRTVDDAFLARNRMTLFECIDGNWLPWTFDAPLHPGQPGVDGDVPTPWQVLVRVLDFAAEQAHTILQAVEPALHPAVHIPEWIHHLATRVGWGTASVPANPAQTAAASPTVVHHAATLARAAGEQGIAEEPVGRAIAELLEFFREHVRRAIWPHAVAHEMTRRACLAMDLGLTLVCGILRDRLLVAGLGSIDGEEFQAWLTRHGAADATVRSSPVRALYDLCFAYAGGDPAQPCFAAGTALGVMLRVAFSYRGSVLYETRVGMGEAVIAPLYEVLRARGVRFEFFHRLTAIEPSEDHRSIGRLRINRQVFLKADEYAPLVDIGGLACWPNRPLLDQIADADRRRLEATGANLESAWSGWQDVETRTLEHGRDFTDVVLGIPVAALATIAAPLAAVDPAWRELLARLPSVQTQAVQLWLTTDLTGRTGQDGRPTSVSAPEPLDTWADMTHLLRAEQWPAGVEPRSLHYICGPLPGNFYEQPVTDPSVPGAALAAIRANTIEWLSRNPGWRWPVAPGSGPFDWQTLFVTGDQAGEERLDSQFLRANIDPTELCVCSPPDAQRVRIPPGTSGFSNLVLAGDWTRTAINAACVEAAVMSGMAASRALCGYPEQIAGENFMQG